MHTNTTRNIKIYSNNILFLSITARHICCNIETHVFHLKGIGPQSFIQSICICRDCDDNNIEKRIISSVQFKKSHLEYVYITTIKLQYNNIDSKYKMYITENKILKDTK